MKRSMVLLAAVCGVFLVQVGTAGAAPQPGLDRSFANGGVLDLGVGPYEETSAWAAAPDGASYVTRVRTWCDRPCSPVRVLTLQRYGPSGEFDQAFGGTGSVTLARGEFGLRPGLAVDATGRLLVAVATERSVTVTRFEASGTVDPSFGSGGYATFECDCSEAGLTLLPRGRPLLRLEERGSSSGQAVVLRRLGPNGGLDGSFGESGVVRLRFRSGAAPSIFAARPNGSILLAGTAGCCQRRGSGPYVSLLSPAGRLVGGFRAAARRALRAVGADEVSRSELVSVVARPDGKVDLLGNFETGGSFVLRLRASGRLERSFARRGVLSLRSGVLAAVRDANGGIVAVREPGEEKEPVMYRLFPNGRLDRRFVEALSLPLAEFMPFGGMQLASIGGRRVLVYASGYRFCRYGGCSQEPHLAMYQGPGPAKRGR